MKNTEGIKGYKVFESDWKCRGFQYEVGKTFSMEEKPKICEVGFHFCTKLSDCFNYYKFRCENKVAEVEALGEIDKESEDSKCCTNKIKIVRELNWHEVLDLCNSGDCNSGNRNSGDCNSGDCNSGNRNSGDCNSGNRNSGNGNSGNRNSGNWNSGDCNSGNWNSGDCNSGDWNRTDYSNGVFCTESPKINFFNKPSKITYEEWLNSDLRDLVCWDMPRNLLTWVYERNMTDEEKEKYPTYKTAGGYLKEVIATNKDRQKWYDKLDKEDKEKIKSMPNFDKDIFKEITGIKV